MVGTVDIFRWSCNCPASSSDGLVCFATNVELMPDGASGYNHAFSLSQFRDGSEQHDGGRRVRTISQ